MFSSIIDAILSMVNSLGYLGIFIGMIVESSFFPFPSEIILIPAGALISQGKLNFLLVFLSAVFGSLIGACINYFLAFFIGRNAIELVLDKYGKFLFLTNKTLKKTDNYFENYGEITTFLGRLIFGVRQLISLPAGFAKMNFWRFAFYTSLGAAVWTIILLSIGYIFGTSGTNFTTNLTFVLLAIALIIGILFYKYSRKN
ncbi:MAG: DedA family protein [Nanoarchaeota archaeon]|nr:DedA family protein [Nanoarchaeota archaeon]